MSDHIGCTRLRMIMLLHFCSTQGQLCPTWQSYAGLPPEEGACVTCFPSRPNSIPVPAAPSGAPDPRSPIPAAPRLRALRARPLPPERSEHNPWHRGPEGPMDAIRPSAPKAQAPAGIQESAADAPRSRSRPYRQPSRPPAVSTAIKKEPQFPAALSALIPQQDIR